MTAAAREAWLQSPLSRVAPQPFQELLENASERFVPAGELVSDGAKGAGTSLVVDGVARIFRRNLSQHAAGRQVTLGYRSAGQFLGLPPALAPHLTPSMQSAGVEALTDVRVLRIPATDLLEIVVADPSVAKLMFEELVATLMEAHDLLAENIFLPVRQRVARHLLDLATTRSGELKVDASQQDIANAIGSVREVVSRAIVGLRDDGLVVRTDGAYTLVRPAGLHRVAEGRDGSTTT